MGWFGWLMAAMAALWVVLQVLSWLFKRFDKKNNAEMVDFQERAYSQRHDYRRVQADAFPRLDRAFYENARAALEREGFSYVADVEDATLAKGWMDPHSFMRLMTTPDRTVTAHFMQVRFSQPMRLLSRFILKHPHLVGFEVEAEDGRFFAFNYMGLKDTTEKPPEFIVEQLDGVHPIEEIVDRFKRAYMKFRTAHPDFVPRPLPTLDDLLESQRRQDDLRIRFRRRVGYTTREELIRAGHTPESAEQALDGYRAAYEEKHRNDPR